VVTTGVFTPLTASSRSDFSMLVAVRRSGHHGKVNGFEYYSNNLAVYNNNLTGLILRDSILLKRLL